MAFLTEAGRVEEKDLEYFCRKKSKQRRRNTALLVMSPLKCQKRARGHSRSQEEEWLCCGGGPEGQGLPRVSALQDSVKL